MADMTIAKEIHNQIGKASFFMIGAKNLVGDEKSLTFKIMRNAKRVTHVRVTLDDSDTYTVEFIKVGNAPKFVTKTLDTISMVYNDMLKSVIGDGTGLELRMPVIHGL